MNRKEVTRDGNSISVNLPVVLARQFRPYRVSASAFNTNVFERFSSTARPKQLAYQRLSPKVFRSILVTHSTRAHINFVCLFFKSSMNSDIKIQLYKILNKRHLR